MNKKYMVGIKMGDRVSFISYNRIQNQYYWTSSRYTIEEFDSKIAAIKAYYKIVAKSAKVTTDMLFPPERLVIIQTRKRA